MRASPVPTSWLSARRPTGSLFRLDFDFPHGVGGHSAEVHGIAAHERAADDRASAGSIKYVVSCNLHARLQWLFLARAFTLDKTRLYRQATELFRESLPAKHTLSFLPFEFANSAERFYAHRWTHHARSKSCELSHYQALRVPKDNASRWCPVVAIAAIGADAIEGARDPRHQAGSCS